MDNVLVEAYRRFIKRQPVTSNVCVECNEPVVEEGQGEVCGSCRAERRHLEPTGLEQVGTGD